MGAGARFQILVIAIVLAFTSPGVCLGAPSSPDPAQATSRVLDLQDEIERNQDDIVALDVRIAVTNAMLFDKRAECILLEQERDDMMRSWESRIVAIYKEGPAEPLEILLGAESFGDLYSRARAVMRLAELDKGLLEKAGTAADQAAKGMRELEVAKQELLNLKTIKSKRSEALVAALAEQRRLSVSLPPAGRASLAARQYSSRMTRKQWRDSSIPIGTPIAKVPGTVEPYTETFLVSEFQPRVYRATGQKWSAVCSWYGNQFNGRPSACGQIFNQDDFTCASKTLPFGTRIALTRGERRIVVVVTDRGPFHPGRDLDLSKAAAEALGFSGVATVQAEFVEVVR